MGNEHDAEMSVFKSPSEAEVSDLLHGCCVEPLHGIARRLAFQRDRLVSAIEGPKGWKEEYAKLKDAATAMVAAWDSHHLAHYRACAKERMGPHFSNHIEALEELRSISAQ